MHAGHTLRLVLRLLATNMPAVMLGITSCSFGPDLPPLPSSPAGPYRLSVNDQIRIVTYGQDSLTGSMRVNDRGMVAVPLLGAVKADGLTSEELEGRIEDQLEKKELLHHPHVTIEITEYRPIFILGEVIKPGEYPYQPKMTVLTAVALAGGFTYRARTEAAAILRTSNHHSVEGIAPRGTEVLPGDVVTIQERIF